MQSHGGALRQPDRDGVLSTDASIMAGDGRCGSVAALSEILHPVSVARKVMEQTPHVMLVGEGAQQFAVQQGFKRENCSRRPPKRLGANG